MVGTDLNNNAGKNDRDTAKKSPNKEENGQKNLSSSNEGDMAAKGLNDSNTDMSSPTKERSGQKKRSASNKGVTAIKRPRRSCTKGDDDNNVDGGIYGLLDISKKFKATEFDNEDVNNDNEEKMAPSKDEKHGEPTTEHESDDEGDDGSTNKNTEDDEPLTEMDGHDASTAKEDRAMSKESVIMTPVHKTPVSKNKFFCFGKT